MGDMKDVFDDMRERSKEKRAHNTVASTSILINKNVSFESKNNGAHLIVSHNGKVVDFWPATGKFICRSGKKDARGIRPLLKYIGVT